MRNLSEGQKKKDFFSENEKPVRGPEEERLFLRMRNLSEGQKKKDFFWEWETCPRARRRKTFSENEKPVRGPEEERLSENEKPVRGPEKETFSENEKPVRGPEEERLFLRMRNLSEGQKKKDFFWEWETCPRARRIAERSPVHIYRSVIRKTSSVGLKKCRVYDQSVTGWDSRHSNSFICLGRSCGRKHFWRRIVRNKPQTKMFVGFRIRGVFLKFSDIKRTVKRWERLRSDV